MGATKSMHHTEPSSNFRLPVRLLVLAVLLTACGGSEKTAMGTGPGGSLAISVLGLPAGTNGRISVTGPGGYSHQVPNTTQLSGLAGGTYRLSAGYVNAQSQTWTATLSADSVLVTGTDTVAVTATYSGAPVTTLNLHVAGVQLIQSTQSANGSVPMVAGRDALFRVFVTANGANSAQPTVRIRLFQGATQVDSVNVTAPSGAVPQVADTATLASSWNVLVPGARVASGLSYQVEVDPSDAIAEIDESDNRWPGGSGVQAVTVQTVPQFDLRFVPITQSVNNLTGQVSGANKAAFAAVTQSMFPLSTTNVDVRATYTTNAPAYQSNDGNGAWSQTLSEISALKSSDGSGSDYVGILQVTYGGGIAGLGYIGYPAAIGWDKASSAPGVIAHELGHNFGRQHAPCGGPSGPDPLYPYANADIGTWGLDLPALSLKAPGTYKDLMSYCNPDWISDYNYLAVLAARGTGPSIQPAAPGKGRGLLVWGRIINGNVILEPAVVVDAPARLPAQAGPHRVEGFDAAGGRVFSLGFAGDLVADLPSGDERHFSYVVPLAQAEQARLTSIRLLGNGLTVVRAPVPGLRAGTAQAPGGGWQRSAVHGTRAGQGVDLRWDPVYPMAVVRDARTGEILSFARGGSVRVPAGGAGVTVDLSDGISTLPRVTVIAH